MRLKLFTFIEYRKAPFYFSITSQIRAGWLERECGIVGTFCSMWINMVVAQNKVKKLLSNICDYLINANRTLFSMGGFW